MFEIPDDDDLFNEDSLKDILKEVNHNAGQQKIEETAGCALQHPGSDLQFQMEKSVGSPQSKKIKVLLSGDVNHQTKNYVALHSQNHENVAWDNRQSEQVRAKSKSVGQVKQDVNHLTPELQQPERDAAEIPRRRSLRRFPGPAGILPPVKPEELVSVIRKNTDGSPQVLVDSANGNGNNTMFQEAVCSSQSGIEVFGGAAWQMLLADLEPDSGDVLRKFSVQAMLHKASRRMLPKGKVPLMLGILDSLDFQSTDASVVVRDPTGQMQGTLHRDVFKDFSTDLQPGAAIVLRQVSVISPSPRTHYLNITAGNIVIIYPVSGHCPVLPSSPDLSFHHDSSSQGLMKSFVQASEVEMLQAANAAREAALSKLRHQGPSARPPSPACGQGNPRLFGNTLASNSRTGLFTPPQRGARLDIPSPVLQPTSAGGPFANRNSTTVTQLRTPMRASTSSMRTPTPDIQISGIQTPGHGGTNHYPGMRTPGISAGAVNNPHTRNSLQSTKYVIGTTVTSHFCSPSPVSCARTTNNSSHPQLENETPTTANNSANQPQTQLRPENQVSNSHSQQTKWSFKRKASTDSPIPVSGVSNHLAKSGVHQQVLGESSGKMLDANITGIASSLQLAAPSAVGLGVKSQGTGATAVLSSAADVAGIMWDEELGDDILSQLSDDF